MPSLKDIKGRIISVRSTLKITSAMKMVSSAKLHGAQNAIENMLPYEASLRHVLSLLPSVEKKEKEDPVRKVAVVAFSSNSSLCGGFNSNVIRETRSYLDSLRKEGASVSVFPVGRKIAEALRKEGWAFDSDNSAIVGKPSYESASDLAKMLLEKKEAGEFDRVELIYNHFVNTASQKVVRETFLPFEAPDTSVESPEEEYILEPGGEELLEILLPKVICLKIYTVVLDTVAAEHAARTIAMQTASDNAEDLLDDLNLEYNKTRQQKITSEILDIVGGTLA